MKLKNFKIFSYLLITVFLTLGISISFQSLLAAYTAPLHDPSTCLTGEPGCDAPISSGSVLVQMIKGGLWIVNSSPFSPYGLIVENGSVGIGTINPNHKLDVQGGEINSSGGYCIAGDCKNSWVEIVTAGTGGTNTWTSEQIFSAGITISGGNLNFTQVINDHFYIDSNEGVRVTLDKNQNDANSSFQINNGGNTTIFSVDESGNLITAAGTITGNLTVNGNVGIGTTNPTQKLDVNGYVKGTGLCIGSNCKVAWGHKYVGATANSYNGATVGGYAGGNSKCASAFGLYAYMCSSSDIAMDLPDAIGWINTFTESTVLAGKTMRDCSSWTTSSTAAAGMFWCGNATICVPPKFATVDTCDRSHPILCCE